MYIVDEVIYFPNVTQADEDGLLAIGGDLSKERLQLAYSSGIFPWYEDDQPILWFSPDPRMVLFFDNLKISKSTRQYLKKAGFSITFNKAFEQVIFNCATIKRKEQEGTWITNDMMNAYIELHKIGVAKSVEVWKDDILVGGLYGVDLYEQKVFCGESMFSKESNASKAAFIFLSKYYQAKSYKLVDCQIHNDYLESLGCVEIARDDFIRILKA